METVLFFYNILIMIAFAFCSVGFALLYLKHRDKSQLCIAAVFLLFIIDNLLLYMNEFLPGFTQGYSQHVLGYTYAAKLLGYCIILSYRMTIIALEKKLLTSKGIFLWGGIFIAVLAVTALSSGRGAGVAEFIVLGIPAAGVFAHAIYRHGKTGGFPKRAFVPNVGPAFLWASLFFELFKLIESILKHYGIFLLSPNRQLSIELLSVFYSVLAIWFLLKSRLSADETAQNPSQDDEDEKAILMRFGSAYMLTPRERDILGFLVQGCSNTEICQAACISEGTVKTHTHNIYSKLDIKNRIQLGIKIREFQKNGAK